MTYETLVECVILGTEEVERRRDCQRIFQRCAAVVMVKRKWNVAMGHRLIYSWVEKTSYDKEGEHA